MIVMDLGALEDEFAANSGSKTAEKTELLLKLRLVKTVLLLSFFLEDPVGCQHIVVNTPTVNERGFRIFSSSSPKISL